MWWTGCIRCKKFRHDFVARTFSRIAPDQPKLLRVLYSNKMILNALKPYETHQNMSLGPMGWTGCVHCKKFHRKFMVQTFALIAPVQPSLHHVSCGNETIPNAPKHHETHQNPSLWSNGVERVRQCEKFRHDFVARTFFTNCTSSAKIAKCFVH